MTNNNQEPSYEKACPFCNVDIPVPQFKSNIDTVFNWHLDGHKENSQPSSVPVEEKVFGQCKGCEMMKNLPVGELCGRCYMGLEPSPSHHEASPKVEEDYIITKLIELNPEKTWKEIEPVYKFVSALLLQKEKEAYDRGYEWGVADEERRALEEDVLKDLPIVLKKTEQIKQEATLTERKRVNDILDRMKKSNEESEDYKCGEYWSTYGYPKALEQAKHLINNTQEK